MTLKSPAIGPYSEAGSRHRLFRRKETSREHLGSSIYPHPAGSRSDLYCCRRCWGPCSSIGDDGPRSGMHAVGAER